MRKVVTKCILDVESNKWTYEESYMYDGPWARALQALPAAISGGAAIAGAIFGGGGASSQDKAIAKDQYQFMQELQNEQGTQFANNQEALTTIKNAWEPIAKGGAYQYGFSTAEDQALQSQIENAGATATENSVAAQQLREQQQSEGAAVMPSGAQEAIEAQQREVGAQKTATNLGQEKELGYQVGRENFAQATSAEEAIANLSNPAAYAGAATSAGEAALGSQKNVDTANANSLTSKVLGGIIGGAGNLDTTGGSSVGEQLQNFGLGMGH